MRSQQAAIVILTGGLGPTEDDVTRDAVADALGRTLVFQPGHVRRHRGTLPARERKMAEINKRQAFVIAGAEVLHESCWHRSRPVDRGRRQTRRAAARSAERDEACVRAGNAWPRFHRRVPGRAHPLPLLSRHGTDRIRPRHAHRSGVHEIHESGDDGARFGGRHPGSPARALLDSRRGRALAGRGGGPIEALLGVRLYSRNGDSLEAVVGSMLRDRKATLAIAESLTGGQLGQRITSVPGSSDYFVGGFLTYTDGMKTDLLGVEPELIAQHTAVSKEVATAMAAGARARSGADYAIATTGEAGPNIEHRSARGNGLRRFRGGRPQRGGPVHHARRPQSRQGLHHQRRFGSPTPSAARAHLRLGLTS